MIEQFRHLLADNADAHDIVVTALAVGGVIVVNVALLWSAYFLIVR